MNQLLTEQTFTPYRPHLSTSVTYRQLPHWQQEGTCAFVTLRTHDSIPKTVKEGYAKKRRNWLQRKGWPSDMNENDIFEKLTFQEKQRFQRYCSSQYQQSLDKGAGACPLLDEENRKIITDAFLHHAGVKYLLGNYVLMPNHLHVLLKPLPGAEFRKTLGHIQHYTARLMNQRMNKKGAFWMPEPFDHLVRSRSYFRRYKQYIRLNPVRAGLRAGEYTLFEVDE